MKPLQACLLFAFILIFSVTQAQRYDTLLTKLNSEYRQEKLYLHFDRTLYNPGETIWFKAYLFAAGYPSQISNTMYAELVDVNGRVIERKTAPVLLSGAAASFDIPTNMNSSVIFVRAYTKWMLNFDSSLIYTKALQLTGLNNKSPSVPVAGNSMAASITPLYYLQFFPEGGDMVQGIPSRVAFKATGATGFPINVTGDIVDSKGKKITAFTTAHDGMGTFLLQPQSDERYKAVWQDASGKIHETLLPASLPTGVTLQLNNKPGKVEFTVKRPVGKASPHPYVYIVAQMNNIFLYKATVNLDRSASANGAIPVQNFPAGIVQVTLFTAAEKPVAERLIFINHADKSFITTITAALSDNGKRKKNSIEIEVPDTLLSNFSVSVTDADLTATQTDDNIFSHILLTSDVKGYVHNPAYYFSDNTEAVVSHLDLVMMTNGWRRFKWEDLLAGKWPALRYLPENYISLEGQVAGLKDKQLSNKELNLIIDLKNGNKQFATAEVLPDGRFMVPEMIFYDTAKIFYQFNNDKNKVLTSKAKFTIKNNLLPYALNYKPMHRLLQGSANADTAIIRKNEEVYRRLTDEELQKVKTLKNVVVNARKKSIEQIRNEEYTSGFFSSANSRTFVPENDPSFSTPQSVFQYLNGRVAGLQINQFGAGPSVSWRGSPTVYFVNEMQTQAEHLQMISMSEVAMIKVFRPPFYGAMGGGGGGAIAVYLKKGASNFFTRGLESVTILGYSPVKEFYSPDYSTSTLSTGVDYRTTLYWNPFVITDKDNRRITLTFYNNDITKKMKVILEGCNEYGQLTRVEKIL